MYVYSKEEATAIVKEGDVEQGIYDDSVCLSRSFALARASLSFPARTGLHSKLAELSQRLLLSPSSRRGLLRDHPFQNLIFPVHARALFILCLESTPKQHTHKSVSCINELYREALCSVRLLSLHHLLSKIHSHTHTHLLSLHHLLSNINSHTHTS